MVSRELELSDELGEKKGMASFLRRAQRVLDKRANATIPDVGSHADLRVGELWRREAPTGDAWAPVGAAAVELAYSKPQSPKSLSKVEALALLGKGRCT